MSVSEKRRTRPAYWKPLFVKNNFKMKIESQSRYFYGFVSKPLIMGTLNVLICKQFII